MGVSTCAILLLPRDTRNNNELWSFVGLAVEIAGLLLFRNTKFNVNVIPRIVAQASLPLIAMPAIGES